ncbi:MAG: hypothetical protein ACRDKH_00955, partial [Solirubrobacterales bacterium]
ATPPAPAPAPAPAEPAPGLERVDPAAAESDDDDSSLPEIGAAALAALVAVGGVWMLRRQRLG